MGRKICVVSGKGGVGKTTITCGMGLALAKTGASVCLVDLDMGLNNLDVLLGVDNKVVYDLADCVEGKCRLKQALVPIAGLENIYLLTSARQAAAIITEKEINAIIGRLASVFDFVLVDAPAGISKGFKLAISSTNEALVVVSPHISSLRDADKVIAALKGADIYSTQIIINRIRGDLVASGQSLGHEEIVRLLKVPLFGVVPESDNISVYSSFRFEVIKKSKDMAFFTTLAGNLKADKKVIFDYQSKYRGLFGAIRRAIKRSL